MYWTTHYKHYNYLPMVIVYCLLFSLISIYIFYFISIYIYLFIFNFLHFASLTGFPQPGTLGRIHLFGGGTTFMVTLGGKKGKLAAFIG